MNVSLEPWPEYQGGGSIVQPSDKTRLDDSNVRSLDLVYWWGPVDQSGQYARSYDTNYAQNALVYLGEVYDPEWEALSKQVRDALGGEYPFECRGSPATCVNTGPLRAKEDLAPSDTPRDPEPLSQAELGTTASYRVGIWRVSVLQGRDTVVWTDGGDLALEIMGGSNGWWQLRKNGVDKTIYPDGDARKGDFLSSWNPRGGGFQRVREPISIGVGPSVVELELSADSIVVTLPAESGTITLSAKSREIRYVGWRNRRFEF